MIKELIKLLPLLHAARKKTSYRTGASRRRMGRPAGIAGVVVLLLTLWSQWNTSKSTDHSPKGKRSSGEMLSKVEQALADKVIDGDTISVQASGREIRIRLLGLDAMDSHNTEKRDAQAIRHGLATDQIEGLSKQAANVLRSTLPKGERVDMVHPGDKREIDDFGRILAYVEINGQDIAEGLLSTGLAEARREPHARLAKYQNLEKQARAARVGIWQAGR